MAVVSDTIKGLQIQLNNVHSYCLEWKLNVNVEKTKIIIFKNVGQRRKQKRWFFGYKEIEVVNAFVYVGTLCTSKMSMSKMA